jgi:hydrogenase nickel incorporation protein HypB
VQIADARAVVFSVTEGEDKPLKYPLAFNTATVAAVAKIDIADAVDFDRAAAYRSMREVNPGIEIVELSAKTGAGMDAWTDLIEARLRGKVQAPAAVR